MSHGTLTRRLYWGFVLVLCGLIPLPAEETAGTPAKIRRIFVPESELPRFADAHRPIEATVFERLVQHWRDLRDGPAPVAITEASYLARYDERQSLYGIAILDVELRAAGPALLPLSSLGLAVERAFWGPTGNRTARILANELGEHWTEVSESGTLIIVWSLMPDDGAVGARFAIPLLPSTRTNLQLILPESKQIQVDAGEIQEIDRVATNTPLPSDLASFQAARRTDERVWRVRIDDVSRLQLRVLDHTLHHLTGGQAQYRDHTTYRISQGNLEVSTEFQLGLSRGEWLDQLQVRVDDPLVFVGAEYQDRPLEWIQQERDPNTTEETYQLRFEEPLRGENHIIRLRAIGQVPPARRALPRISPHKLHWRTGSSVLYVDEPLAILGFQARGAQPQKFSREFGPQPRQVIELQHQRPQPELLITTGELANRLHLNSGMSISLDEDATVARWVADVQSKQGTLFQLAAQIEGNWLIDAVVAQPADWLDDWTMDTSRADAKTLFVKLRRPLRLGDSVRLDIRAHQPRVALRETHELLPVSLFELFRFDSAHTQETMVSLATRQQGNFHIVDDNTVFWFSQDNISPEWASRLYTPAGALVFSPRGGTPGLQLALRQQAPRYSAEMDVTVRVDGNALHETVRITCRPESSTIHQIGVQFPQDRNVPWKWMLDGVRPTRLSARTAEIDPSAERAPAQWIVSLDAPRSAPFTLIGQRTIPFNQEIPIHLMAAADAMTQRGRFTLECVSPNSIRLEGADGLIPLPDASGEISNPYVRGYFSYDPLQITRSTDSLRVVVNPSDEPQLAAAWVELAQVESRISADGTGDHAVTYRIQNRGADTLKVSLSREASPLRAFRDGQDLQVTRLPVFRQAFEVPLNPRQSDTTVTVQYNTHHRPLGLMESHEWSPPQINLPVLHQVWKIGLPHSHIARGESGQDNWRYRLFGPLGRWNVASIPLSDPTAARVPDEEAGWNTMADEQYGSGSFRFTTYQWVSMEAFRWCGFLVSIAVTLRLANPRRALWIPIVAFLGVLPLVVPLPVSPPFSGLWMGTIVGIVISRLRSSALPIRARGQTSAILSGLAVAIMCQSSWGQNGTATAMPSHDPAGVIIPVDADGKPTGSPYQVPLSLYEFLRNQTNLTRAGSAGWQIMDATYWGELGLADQQVSLVRMYVEFELNTVFPSTECLLPLNAAEVDFVAAESRLDGQPMDVQWQESRIGLRCAIPAPGHHRLKLELRPKITQARDRRRCEFAIPRFLSGQLRLRVPDRRWDLVEVRTPARVIYDEPHSELQTTLGPVDKLAFSWRRSLEPVRTNATVGRLTWLRVGSSTLSLEMKLDLRVTAGSVSRLPVVIESSLGLVPRDVHAENGFAQLEQIQENRFVIVFDEPITDQATVVVSCASSQPMLAGPMRLPKILVGDEPIVENRNWWGVTAERELDLHDPLPVPHSQEVAEEFARNWSGATPEYAFAMRDRSADTVLQVGPHDVATSSRSLLHYHFSRDQVRMKYDADASTDQGTAIHSRLSLPPELKVTHVAVSVGDRNGLSHWSQDLQGDLTVSFSEPLQGTYQLTIDAVAALDGASPWTIWQPQLAERAAAGHRLHIYRDPDVEITLSSAAYPDGKFPADLSESSAAVDLTLGPSSQLVADIPGSSDAIVVHCRPHRPLVQAQLITVLLPPETEDRWTVRTIVRLSEPGETPHNIRLSVPQEWQQELISKDAASYQWEDTPTSERKYVWIQVPGGAVSTFDCEVYHRSPANSIVRVPLAQIMNAEHVDHLWVLPHTMQWPGQLSSIDIPADLDLPATTTWSCYRASPQEIQIEGQPLPAAAMEPEVYLADVTVRCDGQGSYQATARFDADVGSLDQCVLRLSPGCQLIGLLVDDELTLVHQMADRDWSIRSGPAVWPRTIEVLYSGKNPGPSRRWQFTAPELRRMQDSQRSTPIDVRRTLWTVFGPADRTLRPSTSGPPPSSADQCHARIDTILTCWEQMARRPSEAANMNRWISRWNRRALLWLERAGSLSQRPDSPAATQLSKLASRQQSLWQQAVTRYGADSATVDGANGHDSTSWGDQVGWPFRLVHEGGQPTVTVDLLPSRRSAWKFHPLPLSVWLALMGVTALLERLALVRRGLTRFPQVIGLLLGFAWAIWLVPAWIGWVVLGVSVWSVGRQFQATRLGT